MSVLSQIEKDIFLKLFNRGGYVLDFSTENFDKFTNKSIGVPLCSKYRLSKGKSLETFIYEANDADVVKLLSDLMLHYECNYTEEYPRPDEGSNFQYATLYSKCKTILLRVNSLKDFHISNAESLKDKFSSDYLTKQIELMTKLQSENPTSAIGLAKELIESCCKTVLERMGIACDRNWDMSKLTGETLKQLSLVPSSISETDSIAKEIKAVLGNLRGITSNLAEIRNNYGSGHGKSSTFTGLEERHAKLAVGCSITFVTFLWDTYEGRIGN